MRIIDLTWRVDLQTADKAKENLEKAKGPSPSTFLIRPVSPILN